MKLFQVTLIAAVLMLGIGLIAQHREIVELKAQIGIHEREVVEAKVRMDIHERQLGDLDAKTATCMRTLEIMPQILHQTIGYAK